jgi:hypothetical protein
MRAILRVFLLVSACGFALSLAVHVLALAGRLPPGKSVIELNLGILVVWLPAVMVANRIAQANRGFSWGTILSGCPRGMRVVLCLLMAYAVVNFALLFLKAGAPPDLSSSARVAVVRRATALDMAFYGAAFALIFSAVRAPQLLAGRRCPKGHPVPPTADKCPQCGQSVESGTKRA